MTHAVVSLAFSSGLEDVQATFLLQGQWLILVFKGLQKRLRHLLQRYALHVLPHTVEHPGPCPE